MTSGSSRQENADVSDAVRVLWIGGAAAEAVTPDAIATHDPDVDVDRATDVAAARDVLAGEAFDCIVVEHSQTGVDGGAAIDAIRDYAPKAPVVVIPTGAGTVAGRGLDANATVFVPPDDDAAADGVALLVDLLRDLDRDRTRAGTQGETRMPIKDKTMSEELRLKELAMDRAPIGITISGMDHPDNPLIYINDSFEAITGYEKERSIGCNCRFLQGPDTDPEKIEALGTAVENEEHTVVELKNYRADGEEFWNRIEIAPLRDESGEVVNYVGFQMDVTARKEAEMALERERENLEHLLERINGLIEDTAGILVDADSTAGIRRNVADRFGSGEEYDLAWIGEYDETAERISPVERAGTDAPLDAATVDLRADDPGTDPFREAIETGEAQVVDDPGTLLDVDLGDSLEAAAVVALPYRDTTYGVLVVYAEDASVFDEREVAVLTALGREIGQAINAVESKRILTTDTVVEIGVAIDDPEPFVFGLSGDLGAVFTYEGSIYNPEGELVVLFTTSGTDPAALEEAAAGYEDITDVEILAERGDGAVVQFTLERSELVEAIADYGGRIRDIEAEDGRGTVRFEVADERAARSIVDRLRADYGADLVQYQESERPEVTQEEFFASVESNLTDRQLTALQKAYVSGFFDWPRQVDGDQLAESMGIVPSTFHQHLRAAQRKLLEAFFET
jgi:hypothetical protein